MYSDELEVLGCTDPNAFSGYNPNATDDDGSCVPGIVEGCTSPIILIYNSSANTDDGSCIPFYLWLYSNPTAFNYNADANTDFGYYCVLIL